MAKVLALVVVTAVAVLSSSCIPRRIPVAPTPEGNTCIRECMQVETQCLAGRGGDYACRVRENECRATCPGVTLPSSKPAPAPVVEAPQPAPAPPPRQLGPPKCVASELPEWAGASATKKKELMDRCRGE